jgi:hypothetical protein
MEIIRPVHGSHIQEIPQPNHQNIKAGENENHRVGCTETLKDDY